MAYENLSTKPTGTSNLQLSRYVDLMSGIIDTPKDSSLLRQAEVINGSMSDEEIVILFHGMNKSSRREVQNGK